MKLSLIAIFIVLSILGCQKDDTDNNKVELQGEWKEYPVPFPIPVPSGTVKFQIGDAYYVGLGKNDCSSIEAPEVQNSLFKFTPQRGWEILKEFPGKGREYASTFILGHKAYIGLGQAITNTMNYEYLNDFWVYDSQQDTWDSLGMDFPGTRRCGALAFTYGDKGYVGTGFTSNYQTLDDMYEYSITNGWTKKDELNLNPRAFSNVFTLENAIYLCLGTYNQNPCRDVKKLSDSPLSWLYLKPLKNSDYPDLPKGMTSSFTLKEGDEEYAYVYGLASSWCYRYDPKRDEWKEVSNLPVADFYFTIQNTLYRVLGITTYQLVKED